MSEPEFKEEGAPNKDAVQMAAFSDKREDLHTALDTLYIYGNASGRNKFREKWPDISPYIFDQTLIDYDNHGVKDLELRSKLEEEADSRRFFLKETIEDMVEKSVDSGTLQFDYVGKVVDAFGPIISTYLYTESVIERVRPGVIANAAQHAASAVPDGEDDGVSSAEKEALSQPSDEPLDEVIPIETDSVAPLQDDLAGTVTIDSDTLDDIVPPEDELDDMPNVKVVDEEAAEEILPEITEEEDTPQAVDDEPKPVEKVSEPPVENNSAPSAEEVSVSNPAPPAETSSVPNPAPESGSNPAPPVGGSFAPPPADEVIAASEVPKEIPLDKPEEIAKPWDKPAEAPIQSNPAPDIPLDQPIKEVNPAPAAGTSLDDPLDDVKPIDMPESSSAALPQTDSQSALSEEQPLQPDEASPQQAELQAEGSQSPEQPEDTPEEQSKESKTDSVSFAGRE